MFGSNEINSNFDTRDHLIRYVIKSSTNMKRDNIAIQSEQMQWHLAGGSDKNDQLEVGAHWVWRAGLCPDLGEYSVTWDEDDQRQQLTLPPQLEGDVYYDSRDTDSGSATDTRAAPARPAPPAASSSFTSSQRLPSALIDKSDPRSRLHYVKFTKKHGRTTKLWECSVCGREFQHQYTLMRHLPTHTDERNYHCSECGKSFRQLSTLSQHRAIHSADRPYSCEVCSKTFNRVSTLISHRKTHSGNKPYKCTLCPKGFYQKGNLRNHLFTHTNERPYRCNLCDKGFNQQSNLVCHKLKAHPDEDSFRIKLPTLSRSAYPAACYDHHQLDRSNQYKVTSFDVNPVKLEANDDSKSILDWLSDDPTTGSEQKPFGMVVDPIKTFHMGVALATKQTPFALLRPEFGSPVLVKVVDTELLGGKQLLVPATAEDLRIGGKVVRQDENKQKIRVPVVATVVSRLQPGGQLVLAVEEPHAVAVAQQTARPMYKADAAPDLAVTSTCSSLASSSAESAPCAARGRDPVFGNMTGPLSVSASPPPRAPPSPPSPCRGLDLFDPAYCMPMGPQITAVGSMDTSSTDEQDIFTHFQDSKLLKLGIHLDSD